MAFLKTLPASVVRFR